MYIFWHAYVLDFYMSHAHWQSPEKSHRVPLAMSRMMRKNQLVVCWCSLLHISTFLNWWYPPCLHNISVDGGQRAVIFDRFTGVKQHVTGEGTHFLIPWVQRPIIFDIRSRPRSVPSVTGSKGNLLHWDHHIEVHLY